MTGEELNDALPSTDQNGLPSVDFRFNPGGARKFGAYTSANVGQPFAIVNPEADFIRIVQLTGLQDELFPESGADT